ncbi:dash complex subunit dam1 [Diplodia corticola]|uniref:DASH complex subunit DAM1 n=1 Tax=Diplodia corticola TaxID=236234 RepID=A0A1J9RZH8_9PEZI|nr:dash complex subunit dam1 [Diplodia corticola]OJD38075.1 dash complex subunit dam1 [Diplodia corticola]
MSTPQAGESTSAHRRSIPSRPTTPLRPTSRSSFRGSGHHHDAASSSHHNRASATGHAPTALEALEPAFAELSDGMADLEANFMHLQLMHESLARFSESFAAFLYGLNMNAFCVDFPEAPLPESFHRQRLQEQAREAAARMSGFGLGGGGAAASRARGGGLDGNEADTEATFMTTDTSFVENPPSSRKPSKFSTPAPSRVSRGGMRGGSSGIARGRGRGGIPRAGGIPRGVGRARGGRG